MKQRFKFDYNEWSFRGRNTGFDRFQKAVVKESRPLYICREIANASNCGGERVIQKSKPSLNGIRPLRTSATRRLVI